MKKFKLFALTALLALGTNAFAATKYAYNNGIWYSYEDDGSKGDGVSEATGYQATVFAVATNEDGVTELTIPTKFTWTSPAQKVMYFKVTGFAANWDMQADTNVDEEAGDEEFEAVVVTLNSLTVNIDNFTDADIPNLVGSLKKLNTLTLVDEKKAGTNWAPTAHTVANLNLTAVAKKTLSTLNIARTGITIEDNAFKVVAANNEFINLTSISLPEGLTAIGKNAFEGFKGTTITIPSTVTTIDDAAFKGAALTGTTFATIASGANAGKVNLATIGANAFENCASIASVSIPALVAGTLSLGADAFKACTSLASATFGSAVDLGDTAFKGCTSLAEVTIPGISTIGANTFEGCTSLATVTISGATTSIGNDAFKGCTALTSLDLSKANITTALNAPFTGCTALTSVTLNNKVTTLAANLFKDTKIEEIKAEGATSVGLIMGAPTAEKPNTTLKKVTLGPVVGMATLTFQYCQALEEVTIAFDAATMTAADVIPTKAFYYCTALKTFNFSPENATAKYVNDNAFLGCSSSPLVNFVTSTVYQTAYPTAPYQTTYGNEAATTITTKADAGTSGKFFAKYQATSKVSINPDEAKVYSVYVDEGTAYFQALQKKSGLYILFANDCVIIKTDEAKEVEISPYNGTAGTSSVLVDDIVCPAAKTTLAALQEAGSIATGQYLYRLTNNAASGGFGFTYYTKDEIPAGQFFIASSIAPAAGRLNVVWLDEDGNVEGETTAIETVKNVVNDGIIFNMAGQQVDGNYKGIVIKNGKKMIQK